MLWSATAVNDVGRVALPAFKSAVPKVVFVVVSRKVTLPVGVPVPGETAATVAVNVTVCPGLAGLGEDVSVTVEPACSTV